MAFTTRKVFQVGDEVEVCSKQDGFHGSYYEATVIENLGDKVDALANDGWWAGIITRKSGDDWFVYFPSTFEHIAYPKKHIRLHLESRRNGGVSRDGRVFSCEGKPLSCKKKMRIVMGESSWRSVKARLV
ncbi:hypothetical protein PRUPE_6G295700 [Prunus persica]|uniref:Agenet-like domain-containing protein n=1 Tax=Prunus persica TaxID=3760 RepID=M5W3P0_PRUPE|nr:hypothetical protein PRUPE_6G295700 [Prunus persica]